MTILAAFLSRVELGAPASLDDLTFIPLLCPDARADADLLEEALAERTAEVVELDDGGDVNAVRCTNRGRRPLLVIDGEELVGAKQNRVLNASFLVAAGTSAVLPVSCVERGRWRHQSPAFASSRRTLSARARTDKLRRVAGSVTLSGVYDADQGAVWRDVETLLTRGRVASPTRAYADLAAVRARETEARVERLAPQPGQVGLAAVRGERLVAIDLLGSPGLYRRGWRKLARGLVAEVDGPTSAPRAAEIVARALVEAAEVACTRAAATGAGETLHGVGAHVVVGAVALDGQVVHAVIGGAGG